MGDIHVRQSEALWDSLRLCVCRYPIDEYTLFGCASTKIFIHILRTKFRNVSLIRFANYEARHETIESINIFNISDPRKFPQRDCRDLRFMAPFCIAFDEAFAI